MHLSNIIKPTHSCNMACKYCYIEDKPISVMNKSTLKNIIKKTFDYSKLNIEDSSVDFIWHGGEPLIAGISFYKSVIELQNECNRNIHYSNSIQTNGTMINEKWADFFKTFNFRVSISIDGPASIHNKGRYYKDGAGSFDDVMRGIRIIKDAQIPLGVCVVISRINKDDILEIYDFLEREKLNFNPIPLNKSGRAKLNYEECGLDADEYFTPWAKMFDRWFYSCDDKYIYCSDFVHKASTIVSGKPTCCTSMGSCSRENISIDPNGYVYPCATMSSDEGWRYGNINEMTLDELMESQVAQTLLNKTEDRVCSKCKWKRFCYGGCLARSIKFHGSAAMRDYYCPSLKKMYKHVYERLSKETGVSFMNEGLS